MGEELLFTVLPIWIVFWGLFLLGLFAWRGRVLLRRWAEDNKFQIDDCRRAWMTRGPFFWKSNRFNVVYYVTVTDETGARRKGWVRCGSLAWGMFSGETTVIWDEPGLVMEGQPDFSGLPWHFWSCLALAGVALALFVLFLAGQPQMGEAARPWIMGSAIAAGGLFLAAALIKIFCESGDRNRPPEKRGFLPEVPTIMRQLLLVNLVIVVVAVGAMIAEWPALFTVCCGAILVSNVIIFSAGSRREIKKAPPEEVTARAGPYDKEERALDEEGNTNSG